MWLWAGRVARECRQDETKGVTLNNETTLHSKSDNIKIEFDEAIVKIWPTETWARNVICH